MLHQLIAPGAAIGSRPRVGSRSTHAPLGRAKAGIGQPAHDSSRGRRPQHEAVPWRGERENLGRSSEPGIEVPGQQRTPPATWQRDRSFPPLVLGWRRRRCASDAGVDQRLRGLLPAKACRRAGLDAERAVMVRRLKKCPLHQQQPARRVDGIEQQIGDFCLTPMCIKLNGKRSFCGIMNV